MNDLLSRDPPTADHRIWYGDGPYQFGDLWIPQTHSGSLLPVVVFFHGGWWKSQYDLGYAGHLCAALKNIGITTWSVEYRRVGETGGGWPTTFQDADAGLSFIETLARTYPMDATRVITMGHSAGGHLAFLTASRRRTDPRGELILPPAHVTPIGTIALAGAVDLRMTVDLSGDLNFAHTRHEVHALMGGSPHLVPERYKAGNPGDHLPFKIPQILVQGTEDDQIPPDLPLRWASLARVAGDSVRVEILPSADHFDVVDPESAAWETVIALVRSLFLQGQYALTCR